MFNVNVSLKILVKWEVNKSQSVYIVLFVPTYYLLLFYLQIPLFIYILSRLYLVAKENLVIAWQGCFMHIHIYVPQKLCFNILLFYSTSFSYISLLQRTKIIKIFNMVMNGYDIVSALVTTDHLSYAHAWTWTWDGEPGTFYKNYYEMKCAFGYNYHISKY